MQTFLPYPSFSKSFACLDNSRLGNQVYREGKTLLNRKWKHHRIAKMWKGYYYSLARYCLFGVHEMYTRNTWSYETCNKWHVYFLTKMYDLESAKECMDDPPWLGDEKLHASHRSNLLRKNPKHYGKFGWKEQDNMPYHWIN